MVASTDVGQLQPRATIAKFSASIAKLAGLGDFSVIGMARDLG